MIQRLKKTEVQQFYQAYYKVLEWFFSFPIREIGLNDISGELQIAKTTAKRVVLQLVDEGFLKRETLGKVWRISCNQHHHYNITRKISHNLIKIYESGIIEEINKTLPDNRAIILFGSYRKGDDTEKSDIDIAVEVLDNKEVRIKELGKLPQFGYRKEIMVNLCIFSRNKIDLNLFSNIANGIILQGFLEVHP